MQSLRLFALLFASVFPLASCDRTKVAFDDPAYQPVVARRQSPPASQAPTPNAERQPKYRELTRELGVVSIGHEAVERFEIRNDSDLPWTLKAIHVNCSCTTTRVTADVFPPEKSESVYVRYKAGSRSGDEDRSIVVEFEEPEAPRIRLSIKAQVRKLMTAEPHEIVASPVANIETTVQKHVALYNFGPSPWQAVNAQANVDWLTVNVREPADYAEAPAAGEPRQCWRVEIVADASGLAVGPYSGVVQFSCPEDANCQESLLVQMNVGSPVRVIPSRLSF